MFENKVKGRLTSLLRRYYVGGDWQEEAETEEILQQAGIYRISEQVGFTGSLCARIRGIDGTDRQVDFSSLPYGISLNGEIIRNLEFLPCPQIKAMYFIENKANYVQFSAGHRGNPEIVTVFHGGFYSPLKRLFFQKLAAALGEGSTDSGVTKAGQSNPVSAGSEADVANGTSALALFHWGDIDLGGFRMHVRLRDEIFPRLKPYRMDEKAFLSLQKYWLPVEPPYARKLEQLQADPRFEVFHPVIAEMLRNGAKLEQEAFLAE